MASDTPVAPLPGTLQGPAVPIDGLVAIPVDEIEADQRLRPIDEEWAHRLGEIMMTEGQRTPIEVCRLPGHKKFTLVAGGHRLAAAQMFFDLSPIKAIIVSNDALDRKMAEISENVWRKGLDPIDRATFVAEMVSTIKTRQGVDPKAEGRAASANARWQKALSDDADDATATIAVAYGWSEQAGEKLGLSARTIRDDLLLYKRLTPSTIARFRKRNHPILSNASELKALAKLDPSEQSKIVSLLLHAAMNIPGAPFAKVGEAMAANKGHKKPSPEDKRHSTFMGTFKRMGVAERKGTLSVFLKGLSPSLRTFVRKELDRIETMEVDDE